MERARALAAGAEYVDLAGHAGYQAAFMAALAVPRTLTASDASDYGDAFVALSDSVGDTMPPMFDLLALASSRTVIVDGAMGTQLQLAGLGLGECGSAWNLDHPERLHAIHSAYIEAGCDAVITNSFGANRWVLGRYGLDGRVEEVNRSAAANRQARGRATGSASSETSGRAAACCPRSARSTGGTARGVHPAGPRAARGRRRRDHHRDDDRGRGD